MLGKALSNNRSVIAADDNDNDDGDKGGGKGDVLDWKAERVALSFYP